MKQRITFEQLNELTPDKKDRLQEWWKPVDGDYFVRFKPDFPPTQHFVGEVEHADGTGVDWFEPQFNELVKDYPLLSIGQMIEFLKEDIDRIDFSVPNETRSHYREGFIVHTYSKGYSADELCDALWESVKSAMRRNG